MFIPVTGDPYHLFSKQHLIDFVNEIMFLSPMIIPLLALSFRLPFSKPEKRPLIFLALAASGFLAYSFFWRPDLGYPRDWDLFSNTGIMLSIAAVVFTVKKLKNRAAIILIIAMVLNISHTMPWVVSNALGKGKGRNKILLPLGGPVNVQKFTLMRDTGLTPGTYILPVDRLTGIKSLKIDSVISGIEESAYYAITIYRQYGNPVSIARSIDGKAAGKKHLVSFTHDFAGPEVKHGINPTRIDLSFLCDHKCVWQINTIVLIKTGSNQ